MSAHRDHVSFLAITFGCFAALLGVVIHASLGDGRATSEGRAVVKRMGLSGLALSTRSRWVRQPRLVELGAPFADGPLTWDPDPVAGVVTPEARAAELENTPEPAAAEVDGR